MKINQCTSLGFIIMIGVFLSCEQQVAMESVVHDDGSIDRTIILSDGDSALIVNNIFDAGQAQGWETTIMPAQKGEGNDPKKINVRFHKHYKSVDDANQETNAQVDTLFRVRSSFEKKFKWFYTYLRYSDTYMTVNRFHLSAQDYFTAEDHAFIERLPAESVRITKADSLYLKRLSDKLYDLYATRAFYEEAFEKMVYALRESKLQQKWLDTLARNKEKVYQLLIKGNVDDDKWMPAVLDSLNIPMPSGALEKYTLSSRELEKRMNFMSDANEGKYVHNIKMPWPVVKTNADSVMGSDLYWKPRVAKFLLRDYEMFAESRTLNYWTLWVSGAIVLGSGWVLLRRRKK